MLHLTTQNQTLGSENKTIINIKHKAYLIFKNYFLGNLLQINNAKLVLTFFSI